MRWLLFSVGAALILQGCSSSEGSPEATPGLKRGVATVTLKNFGTLDSTKEQFVLWLHSNGSWSGYALTRDTAHYRAVLSNVTSFDSAKISIESLTLPRTPTSAIVSGSLSANAAILHSDFADLSEAIATATFATRNADTNRAKHEFYLMENGAGDTRTSIKNLPSPPSGWRYGIWVINANFVPTLNLFFGSFTASQGASPDAFATSFDYPGGYYVGDFLSEGASIVATLEPMANLSSRPHHASLIEIMRGQLHRFINMNDTIALSNTWQAPSANVVIR